MPWDRKAPGKAKYKTVEHRRTRAMLMAQLERDGQGTCAEVICVYRTRTITPSMDLHLCHNDAGTEIRGLGHARCNLRAASLKARRIQARTLRRSNVW